MNTATGPNSIGPTTEETTMAKWNITVRVGYDPMPGDKSIQYRVAFRQKIRGIEADTADQARRHARKLAKSMWPKGERRIVRVVRCREGAAPAVPAKARRKASKKSRKQG